MISIIIATFNAAKVLRMALDSVLMQTLQDWECIIVDGMSKDDTLAIVEEYERLDNRFWHISEPDRGVFDAFNKGWKNAKGDWIYYLGSDDKVTKDGLETLIKYSKGYDIIIGNVYGVYRRGMRLCRSKGVKACHQGIIVKKTIMEELGGFDLSFSLLADFDLMCKLKYYKWINVDVSVAYFATGGISQSISNQLGICKERMVILKKNNIKYPILKSVSVFCKKTIVLLFRSI